MVCVCVYVCYHLCKTPTSLLVVCDKLFGPHSAAERAVPGQITRRQASGRFHWPGHTHIWTEGWCKAMAPLQSEETTFLQAQKTNCVSFCCSFLSLSHRAGRFWREVSVWRANMYKDMVIRKCILVTKGKKIVLGHFSCKWNIQNRTSLLCCSGQVPGGISGHLETCRPFLVLLGFFGWHVQTHMHTIWPQC